MRNFVIALMVGLLAFSAPALAQEPAVPQAGDPCQTPDGQQGVFVPDDRGGLSCQVNQDNTLLIVGGVVLAGAAVAGIVIALNNNHGGKAVPVPVPVSP